MTGSPLSQYESPPAIAPIFLVVSPRGLNPGHSHEMPESKPLVQQLEKSGYVKRKNRKGEYGKREK